VRSGEARARTLRAKMRDQSRMQSRRIGEGGSCEVVRTSCLSSCAEMFEWRRPLTGTPVLDDAPSRSFRLPAGGGVRGSGRSLCWPCWTFTRPWHSSVYRRQATCKIRNLLYGHRQRLVDLSDEAIGFSFVVRRRRTLVHARDHHEVGSAHKASSFWRSINRGRSRRVPR
jgi:hypothetical protein